MYSLVDGTLYASVGLSHIVAGKSFGVALRGDPLGDQELEPWGNMAVLAERADSIVPEVDYRKMAPLGRRPTNLRVHDVVADAASLALGQMISW